MKAKNILSIAAFFTAFAVSAALVMLFFPVNTTDYRATSCFTNYSKSTPAGAIRSFVRQDAINGSEHQWILYRIQQSNTPLIESPHFYDYAESVEKYVNASGSMDVSEMPRDFRFAWRKHIKAWRDFSAFLNNAKNSRYQNNYSYESLPKIEADYTAEINQTFDEVLRVAENHGADVRGF